MLGSDQGQAVSVVVLLLGWCLVLIRVRGYVYYSIIHTGYAAAVLTTVVQFTSKVQLPRLRQRSKEYIITHLYG